MRKPLPPCTYIELPWTGKGDWDDMRIIWGNEWTALKSALPWVGLFFLLDVIKEVLK